MAPICDSNWLTKERAGSSTGRHRQEGRSTTSSSSISPQILRRIPSSLSETATYWSSRPKARLFESRKVVRPSRGQRVLRRQGLIRDIGNTGYAPGVNFRATYPRLTQARVSYRNQISVSSSPGSTGGIRLPTCLAYACHPNGSVLPRWCYDLNSRPDPAFGGMPGPLVPCE